MSEAPGGVAFKSHDGLLNPDGNLPHVLASRSRRSKLIPFTVGHLASVLVEAGEISANSDAVRDYFDMSTLRFGDLYSDEDQVDRFLQIQARRETESVETELSPKFYAHMQHIERGLTGYEVAGEDQVVAITETEQRIGEITATYPHPVVTKQPDDEYYMEAHLGEYPPESQRELVVLRLKRSALISGVAVPMGDLLGITLGYTDETPLSVDSISAAADDLLFELRGMDPVLLLGEVMLGQREVGTFLDGLGYSFRSSCWKEGQRKVERLQELIYAV